MAVYNTDSSLVERAMKSVLRQTYGNFELIVIDDGSSECIELQVGHEFLDFSDQVRFIRHENMGQAKSINRGVSICTGEYVAIIDSDDEFSIHHLSACAQEMVDADLIASTTRTIVDSEDDY